jgi:hypothetical protein
MIYWCVEGGIAVTEFLTLKQFARTYGVRFVTDVVLFVSD